MKPIRSRSRIRIALLSPILSPYREPLFELLSGELDLDLRVFFDTRELSNRPTWRSYGNRAFDYSVVPSMKISLPWKISRKEMGYIWENRLIIPCGLPFYLKKFDPHVVISLEFGIRTLLALPYIKLFAKKLIIWSEEYLAGTKKYSRVRMKIRRVVASQAHAFCSCGVENKNYLLSLGAKEDKLFNVSMAVNNDFFRERATDQLRNKTRSDFGLKGTIFLNAGQFITRKGLDHLINSWAMLPYPIKKNATLLLVGGGTEEKRLRNLINMHKLDSVKIVDFQPVESLPAFYAAADIFIFPTLEDAWGLVVNEAMACGKPVLCSVHAGCSSELIKEGVNGYLFDPLDSAQTVSLIRKMYEMQPNDLLRMGAASQKIIEQYNYARMVSGFKKAIYSVSPPNRNL